MHCHAFDTNTRLRANCEERRQAKHTAGCVALVDHVQKLKRGNWMSALLWVQALPADTAFTCGCLKMVCTTYKESMGSN
eukprot:1150199-Pelagomonas_calceolata.AAC.6